MKNSLIRSFWAALSLAAVGCSGDEPQGPRSCEEQAAAGASTCDEREDADAATVLPEGKVSVSVEGGFGHVTIELPGDAPEGDFGTSEQALTIPNGYGTVSNAVRCWSGVNCRHPGSRTYPRNFKASTCDGWQQGRWVSGEIRALASTSADGSSAGATWTITNGTKNTFRCGTNAQAIAIDPDLNGALGVAVTSVNTSTNKYIKSDIWIFPENMEAQPGWWNRSIAEVEKFYENTILHEILHSMGIGHTDAMGGSVLMKGSPGVTWYSSFLTVSGTERGWLRDYRP